MAGGEEGHGGAEKGGLRPRIPALSKCCLRGTTLNPRFPHAKSSQSACPTLTQDLGRPECPGRASSCPRTRSSRARTTGTPGLRASGGLVARRSGHWTGRVAIPRGWGERPPRPSTYRCQEGRGPRAGAGPRGPRELHGPAQMPGARRLAHRCHTCPRPAPPAARPPPQPQQGCTPQSRLRSQFLNVLNVFRPHSLVPDC